MLQRNRRMAGINMQGDTQSAHNLLDEYSSQLDACSLSFEALSAELTSSLTRRRSNRVHSRRKDELAGRFGTLNSSPRSFCLVSDAAGAVADGAPGRRRRCQDGLCARGRRPRRECANCTHAPAVAPASGMRKVGSLDRTTCLAVFGYRMTTACAAQPGLLRIQGF